MISKIYYFRILSPTLPSPLPLPSSSPVDGRRSSMQGQDRGVVDDGAVLGVIDYVHGDELGAEGHDVELGAHSLVRFQHLWDGLPLDSPPWELEHRRPVLLCRHRWKSKGEFISIVQKPEINCNENFGVHGWSPNPKSNSVSIDFLAYLEIISAHWTSSIPHFSLFIMSI